MPHEKSGARVARMQQIDVCTAFFGRLSALDHNLPYQASRSRRKPSLGGKRGWIDDVIIFSGVARHQAALRTYRPSDEVAPDEVSIAIQALLWSLHFSGHRQRQ